MNARRFDATTDPALRSFVPLDRDGDFPIQNLPYGAFVRRGERDARLGVAIGESILDLHAVADAGLLDDALPDAGAVFGGSTLNAFLARGRGAWHAVRARLSALLRADCRELHDAGIADAALVPQRDVALRLPFEPGDYVDFYSSLEHATNLGKILRPNGEPLLPNWRWLPIGYHGRSATIVVDGTPIVRPRGQAKPPEAAEPAFGATRALDFELELAFVTGDGPALGDAIDVTRARDLIFGVALLNDWSARDVQAWEYQPLGPFLGKSFATTLSPWIVTLDALEPFRVAAPQQAPPPLAYLATAEDEAYDIALEVTLASAAMRAAGTAPARITHTNFRGMYWTAAQQLTHLASNGARIRAGDVCGSGTISGSEPGSYGSMIELTWRGAHPLALPDETTRAFLEDGDTVTLRGWCDAAGCARIGLGRASGTIVPAR